MAAWIFVPGEQDVALKVACQSLAQLMVGQVRPATRLIHSSTRFSLGGEGEYAHKGSVPLLDLFLSLQVAILVSESPKIGSTSANG